MSALPLYKTTGPSYFNLLQNAGWPAVSAGVARFHQFEISDKKDLTLVKDQL